MSNTAVKLTKVGKKYDVWFERQDPLINIFGQKKRKRILGFKKR